MIVAYNHLFVYHGYIAHMDYIQPIHYDLSLYPNLQTFKFNGVANFTFTLTEPKESIELHALDISFQHISLIKDDNEVQLEFELDLENQVVSISFGEQLEGDQILKFEYTAEHNDKLAGWYRGKFYNPDGEEKWCVVSQFQANDARRAFPCVDIPGKKATFDVEFICDRDLFAISNMPIVFEEDYDDTRKVVRFDTTPKMSTYLLFFGVGDFEYIEKIVGERRFRTLAHPPKAKKHGQFSLDFGIEVVEYLEDYFDYSYPLPKLDQIATPAFAAGAMENWGAILYRESSLLYYNGITSQSQMNRILSIIAHEIVHQWFGNLVSPKTWKYLWLNESFANFFATHTVDTLRPERNMFDFYVVNTRISRRSRSTAGVMDWDSMIATSPIELKGEGMISYTAKTLPVLYEKGGSILRQVKTYLGDEGFRDGLRHYFKQHAYGTTKSDYLWTALKQKTDKPVNTMMETWILQKGLPLITVQRNGNQLILSQERFTYLDHDSDNTWIVPITLKLFKDVVLVMEQLLVLDQKLMSFDIDTEFDGYKLNTDMTGFYRVRYPQDDYAMLKKLVSSKQITAIDRLVLEDELFALLKATKITKETYLDFLGAYQQEDSHLPLYSIALHLRDIYELAEGDNRSEIASVASEFLTKVFDNIGYTPKENEPLGISIIRGKLLGFAVELDTETAKEFALKQFDKLKQGESVNADIRGAIKAIGAKLTSDFDWFKDQFDNPESESEFVTTILAMTSFDEEQLLDRILDMVFRDIPSHNRGYAIGGLCRNPIVKDQMWEWYIANLDSFEAMNNFMYQRAIVNVVSTGMDKIEEMKAFFETYTQKNPNSADAAEVGLEQLKINTQLKQHLNR